MGPELFADEVASIRHYFLLIFTAYCSKRLLKTPASSELRDQRLRQKNADVTQSWPRRSDFSARNAAGMAGTAASAGSYRNHQSGLGTPCRA